MQICLERFSSTLVFSISVYENNPTSVSDGLPPNLVSETNVVLMTQSEQTAVFTNTYSKEKGAGGSTTIHAGKHNVLQDSVTVPQRVMCTSSDIGVPTGSFAPTQN